MEDEAGFLHPNGEGEQHTTSEIETGGKNNNNDESKQKLFSSMEQEHFDDEDDHTNNTNHHHHNKIGSARTPWYGTMVVLLSEVMGTGVLSLPYAAKTLGWGSAMIAAPLFAIAAAYSGCLLAFVKNEFRDFGSYAQASKQLFGYRFGSFTNACMLLNWGAMSIYYLIALANGIGDLFGDNLLQCGYQRGLVAIAVLILPCQCRDFYGISKYLSIPSTLSVLILLIIITVKLVKDDDDGNFGKTTTLGPLPGTNILDFLQALSAFVFAYQGQTIFLELMSEMKDARQFPGACTLAYALMCIVYAMTVFLAYGLKGADTPEFLPDSLPPGLARSIVGALVVLHITVSYVINSQPLHSWLHATFFPRTHNDDSGSMHWFVITTGFLLFGFVVGNIIPFFADVQALIGSLFGAPSIFGWPAAFYVIIHRHKTSSWKEAISLMGYGPTLICIIFLFVCTPLFVVLGTTGAIQSIVEDLKAVAGSSFIETCRRQS